MAMTDLMEKKTVSSEETTTARSAKRIAYGIAGCCTGRKKPESVTGQIGCF
jgi:hypothetical protein